MKPYKFTFFTKYDVLLLLIICTLATILNMYANPFLAATVVVGGILLMRVIEYRENEQKNDENKPVELKAQYIEKRSVHDIITQKLNEGIIEKAIDDKFDDMVKTIVDQLFGKYGDVSKSIEAKLKENMNQYIGTHNFSQYNTKLEHLLNQLVESMTKDQKAIIQNVNQLMGLPPVKEIKTSELFDKFATHIASNIDTDKLEIDTDDEPSYENLTGRMTCEDTRGISSLSERKILTFACDEDENMQLRVTIHRWTGIDKMWTIEQIKRHISDETIARNNRLRDMDEVTSLQTPISNLQELNDFEVYLLKLFYDHTAIILDELEIEDEDIEVEAEPEWSIS